jgi:hypothetical protein
MIWVSPWRWYYYPDYWTPWEPWYWHRYYGYHSYRYNYYYGNYRYCHNYRNPVARNRYYGRRMVSNSVVVVIRSGNFRKTYSHPNQKSEGKMEYFKDKAISPNKGRALEEGKPKNNIESPKTTIRKVPKNISVDNPSQNNNQQEIKSLNKRPSKVIVEDNDKPKIIKPSRDNSNDNIKQNNTRPSRENSNENIKQNNSRPSRESSNENINQNNTRPSRENSNENIKVQKNQSSGSGNQSGKGRIKP